MITEVTKLLGIQYPRPAALASSEHRRHRQSGFGMKSAKQKN